MSLDRHPQSDAASAPTDSGTTSGSEATTKPSRYARIYSGTSSKLVIMSESIKHTLTSTRLRNFILFMLLIAGAIATGPRVAGIRPRPGRCPPCAGLVTSIENFDSVTVPALPIQWLATNALGPPPLWVTSNTGQPSPPADTPPNAAFIDDPDVISDKRLDSMLFSFFEGCCPQLSFRHNFNLEASDVDPSVGFDGGVLELSTDGGNTFQEVTAGAFVMGGYNRTISTDRGSPIGGHQAWSGDSGGFITTIVNLPIFGNPAGGRLRWRMASDNTGSGQGWRIDTVTITWCHQGQPCTPIPRPTPAPRPAPSAPPSPHATPAFTPHPRPSP